MLFSEKLEHVCRLRKETKIERQGEMGVRVGSQRRPEGIRLGRAQVEELVWNRRHASPSD